MATPSIARPVQALRQRERGPRPALGKRSTTVDGGSDAPKKRKLTEPFVRTTDYILRKHKGKAPSMIIHLHNTYFRFNGQEESWAYNGPMQIILQHMRDGTVPHDMLEELFSQNVPFYDGCLIVEVQNHKTKDGREKGRLSASAAEGGPDGKFSMHHYNEHITPSPMVPYPTKLRTDELPDKSEASSGGTAAAEGNGGSKAKDNTGPRIYTTVLHPTALTHHHEMRLLANTPASEFRSKKKTGESGTPSSAQPPQTPQLSVPPTPITTTRGALSQSQQMFIEEGEFYSFQASVLMATEPPLFLEPVSNPQDAERVLEMLADPLHTQKPPSPKTRKRTTAEMAADDAQAAEAERRMLIMDERIKPSTRAGANASANETQGAAASLSFSRFKTLEMVRQKHEEQERIRKDDEHRAGLEKKQIDEQLAAHNAAQHAAKQALLARQNRDRDQSMLIAQQQAISNRNLAQQKHEQLRLQQMEQQRHAQVAREQHGHPPQQSPLIPNPQQGNFQHSAMMPQSSPAVRHQTPMVNSSPMMHNGGFSMAPTSSQGAGSPPRPTSAAMQNRHVSMARQSSQTQLGSQHNTPQLPQGTPNMGQVMPNRQMTQTPRIGQSPAPGMQGTPTSAAMHHMQPTPHMAQSNNLTPEQLHMLHQQATMRNQHAANHAGSPAGQQVVQNMTPEQIQQIRAQQRAQQQAMMAAQANPQAYQAQVARQRQVQQLRQMQAMGQAGTPGAQQVYPQATPQMGHAHPGQQQTRNPQHQSMPANGMPQQHQQQHGGQATPEQLVMAQARSQQVALQRQTQLQLTQVATQFGGWQNIPQQTVQTLPANVQHLLKQQHLRHHQMRQQNQMRTQAQNMAQQNGGALGAGGDGQQVPAGQPNPQYMQQLRTNQQMLAMQMAQHNQMANSMGGMAGSPNTGMNMGMAGTPNNLDQHFAKMQNALNQPQQRGPSQGGGGPQQRPGMQ
ncbi:hypothetical protein LTR08_000094 [Meristemomyces frigidus]|nr:hypothetical protein LTR08_000094 [Meristemomyces frigidus]